MGWRASATAGVLAGTLAAPLAAAHAGEGSRDAAADPVTVRMRVVDAGGLRDGSLALRPGLTRVRADVSLVGVTWTGSQPPVAAVRARTPTGWGEWQEVEPMVDLGTAAPVRGSEPLWVGDADAVHVRLAGAARGVRLVLIAPGRDPRRRTPGAGVPMARPVPPSGARSALPKSAPRPGLHGRRDWGANETWRDGRPRYNDKLKQVHIHHTANSNDYRRSEVRGILRSIYRYHTRHLGWSDLGYNFLVDRFGRAWVGRAGGADRLVRGAHTLGFNHSSTGIAVIGNFENAKPRADVVTMLVRLSAWKLDRHDRNPDGTARVTSRGSDLFRSGRRVRLPVIDGHRDTNQTACPGQRLYDLLPQIRDRAAHRAERFS